MQSELQSRLKEPLLALAREAGAVIMDVYERADHGITSKQDESPLTKADIAAHDIIVERLRELTPTIPVLSEEDADIPWLARSSWKDYWLVDPLDGTKEFIKRNGEFTVNIALVSEGVPVMGVVYAPVLDWLYFGAQGEGAQKQTAEGTMAIATAQVRADGTSLRVVASRNHRGDELDAWLAEVAKRFPDIETVSMGSSLKICLVAEGSADIYPRLAPTCEWDTAAAQAVLEAAGGTLVDESGKEYRYNRKDELLNPHFFAVGDRDFEFPKLSGQL